MNRFLRLLASRVLSQIQQLWMDTVMGNRFPRIYLVYFFLFSSYFVPVLHTSDFPETYMLLSCIILSCSRQDSLSYSNRSLLRHLSSRHPCISLLYIMRLYMYLDTRTCNTGYCLLYLVCFYLQALAQFFKLLLSSIDYSSLDRQPLLRGYFDLRQNLVPYLGSGP